MDTNNELKKKIDALESAVTSAKVELESRIEKDDFKKEVDKYMDRLVEEQEVIGMQLTFNFQPQLQEIKDRMDKYIDSPNAGDYALAKQMYQKLQEKYGELVNKVQEVNQLLGSFSTILIVLKNS